MSRGSLWMLEIDTMLLLGGDSFMMMMMMMTL